MTVTTYIHGKPDRIGRCPIIKDRDFGDNEPAAIGRMMELFHQGKTAWVERDYKDERRKQ